MFATISPRLTALCLALPVVACGGDESSDDDFGFEPTATMGPMTGGTASTPDDGSTAGTGDTGASDDTGGSDDTGMAPDDGPHALGRIVLGESHSPGGADATAFLTASFFPNADAAAPECAMEIGGCTVVVPPSCATPCLVGEVCEFNAACVAECTEPCNLPCGAGEVCYFPVPGVPACRELETFDAGRLDFVGTKVPITLYPPYVLPAGVEGTLTMPDAMVTVSATGATEAGFAPFEATVVTTESVFSTIDTIPLEDAFGPGDMPVSWVAGADDVVVSIQVNGNLGGVGTITCEGDDATGTVSVPRPAIEAAVAEMDTISSMQVSVTRQRTETTMGHPTVGALIGEDVPAEGWIEFTFASRESTTIVGCSAGLTPCGATCVNVQSDPLNCGMCSMMCAAGQICSAGTCL